MGVRKNISAMVDKIRAYEAILTDEEFRRLKKSAQRGLLFATEGELKEIIERERKGRGT